MKMILIQIEAWGNEYGWEWNNWHKLESVYIEKPTNRKILKCLREWGYLTNESKGKLSVYDDQYNFVICNKNNGMPLLALQYEDVENWSE